MSRSGNYLMLTQELEKLKQEGQEISVRELSRRTGLARNTISKDKGFSKNEIVEYLKIHNQNPPSERTVRKYYNMESVPDNPGANLEKDKVFAAEPFHSAIVEIVENLPKGYYISSVYDVLEERFVESGEYSQSFLLLLGVDTSSLRLQMKLVMAIFICCFCGCFYLLLKKIN